MAPSTKTLPKTKTAQPGEQLRGLHLGITPGNGTGGSYAPKSHSDDVDALTGDYFEAVDWSDTGLPAVSPITASGLTAEQILEAARRSAYMRTSHDFIERGMDRDDVAAETALRAWQGLEKERGEDATIRNPKGYISKTAASVVSNAVNGHERAENVRARKMFRRMLGDAEQEVGRSLTRPEQVALQHKIVDEWEDQRHKPTATCFTLGPVEHVDLTNIENLAEHSIQHHEDGSSGDDLMSEGKDRRVIKREGWNSLAEIGGLPSVQNGSLSWRRAKAFRAAMGEDGVRSAAKAHGRGEIGPQVDALFGPFGALDESEKDDVAAAFVRYDSYAQDLWDSAVSSAGARAGS